MYILRSRISPAKNHSIWLTRYDERRAISDVKHGNITSYRNTYVFQTAFDSQFFLVFEIVSQSLFLPFFGSTS